MDRYGKIREAHVQWIGFVGEKYRKAPYFMGKSMVSGDDFPLNQSIEMDLFEFGKNMTSLKSS